MPALLPPASSIRALAFHRRLPVPLLLPPPRTIPRLGPAPARSFMAFSAELASGEEKAESEEEPLPATAAAGGAVGDAGEVSHEEWRRWGTSSPLPAAVSAVVLELLEMEAAAGEKMRFGGVGSKLKVASSSSLFFFCFIITQLPRRFWVFWKLLGEQCRS